MTTLHALPLPSLLYPSFNYPLLCSNVQTEKGHINTTESSSRLFCTPRCVALQTDWHHTNMPQLPSDLLYHGLGVAKSNSPDPTQILCLFGAGHNIQHETGLWVKSMRRLARLTRACEIVTTLLVGYREFIHHFVSLPHMIGCGQRQPKAVASRHFSSNSAIEFLYIPAARTHPLSKCRIIDSHFGNGHNQPCSKRRSRHISLVVDGSHLTDCPFEIENKAT